MPQMFAVEVVVDRGPLARVDLPKARARIGRFEDAPGGRDRDEIRIVRMCRDGDWIAHEPCRIRCFPCLAVVRGEVQAGPGKPRTWGGVPDIDHIGIPARTKDVKVGLALESKLVPGLSAVAAAHQTERIDQRRPWRGMA